MFSDAVKVKGRLQIKKYDSNNSLVQEYDFKNLVVYLGKKLIASRLFADTTKEINVASVTVDVPPLGSSTVTYTFSTPQPSAPYYVGQRIEIIGAIPSEYNGASLRVVSCTTTQVTVEKAVTNTYTSGAIIASLGNTKISKMAVGSGPTAASLADINLYIQRDIQNIYSAERSFADGDSSLVYLAQFPATQTGSPVILTEAALYNEENTMMCRSVFTPIEKANTESLEIFWTVTIA